MYSMHMRDTRAMNKLISNKAYFVIILKKKKHVLFSIEEVIKNKL